jgi:hypothetical protein
MLSFVADPRDAYSANSKACNSCCCQPASARPGEVNKWSVNYAGWSANLSGRGLLNKTVFDIEQVSTGNDPNAPTNTNYYFPVVFNTQYAGVVSTNAVDPDEGELKYTVDRLIPATNGEVTMQANGSFVYKPNIGFTGYDEFYFVTDNGNKRVVNQVILGVAPQNADALPAKAFDKPLRVIQRSVHVDNDVLTFALEASPILPIGEVYRMTIRQPAMDCDCTEYFHMSCFDIATVIC